MYYKCITNLIKHKEEVLNHNKKLRSNLLAIYSFLKRVRGQGGADLPGIQW